MNSLFNPLDRNCLSASDAGLGSTRANASTTRAALILKERLPAPLAPSIRGIGLVSVIYAVYIQKRELKCACVGGNSNVPFGFVRLTENMMMVSMAIWMSFTSPGIAT